jgi:hypothetical protein
VIDHGHQPQQLTLPPPRTVRAPTTRRCAHSCSAPWQRPLRGSTAIRSAHRTPRAPTLWSAICAPCAMTSCNWRCCTAPRCWPITRTPRSNSTAAPSAPR